jgi:hypothetical protein
VTAETLDGKKIYSTARYYMPQAGDSLGGEMMLGPDKKLGFLRDTTIQPFAPKEENLEIALPVGVREVVVKVALSYQPRPGNVYPLHEKTFRVPLDK